MAKTALIETKRDRFVRLAERRVTKAIQAIRLVSNLANRNNYEYSDADARKISAALSKELDVLRQRFDGSPLSKKSGFKL